MEWNRMEYMFDLWRMRIVYLAVGFHVFVYSSVNWEVQFQLQSVHLNDLFVNCFAQVFRYSQLRPLTSLIH